VLLAFIGSGIVTGGLSSSSMMGSGTMVGINWMWLPFLLLIILTAILIRIIFGKKNVIGSITLAARSVIALYPK